MAHGGDATLRGVPPGRQSDERENAGAEEVLRSGRLHDADREDLPNRNLASHMKYVLGTVAAAVIAFAQTSMAQPPSSAIGVVIMHGKGASPAPHESSLASSLEQTCYHLANLGIPCSANRETNPHG